MPKETKPTQKEFVPHNVVTEFIGQFDLGGDPLETAEAIASYSYRSLETLFTTIQGTLSNAKLLKSNRKIYEICKTSDFFKPYIPNV